MKINKHEQVPIYNYFKKDIIKSCNIKEYN